MSAKSLGCFSQTWPRQIKFFSIEYCYQNWLLLQKIIIINVMSFNISFHPKPNLIETSFFDKLLVKNKILASLMYQPESAARLGKTRA